MEIPAVRRTGGSGTPNRITVPSSKIALPPLFLCTYIMRMIYHEQCVSTLQGGGCGSRQLAVPTTPPHCHYISIASPLSTCM